MSSKYKGAQGLDPALIKKLEQQFGFDKPAWQRFGEIFPTVVYFGSDEHEWAFLSALAERCDDPVATMSARLPGLGYRPQSIDAATLVASTIPPMALRSG